MGKMNSPVKLMCCLLFLGIVIGCNFPGLPRSGPGVTGETLKETMAAQGTAEQGLVPPVGALIPTATAAQTPLAGELSLEPTCSVYRQTMNYISTI